MAYTDLNDTVISQVRQSADIVDIVSQSTPLKLAGRSHKGLCPFHREKTPSFHVDRDKGFFYCFGCGTGGDVFKFVMLTERMNFPEAVEYVAQRVGITLPKKQKERAPDKDDLLQMIEDAAEAFHQALGWTPNPAAEYLVKRGVDKELWSKYGFGYAPDSWDYLLSRLGRKYKPERFETAGLALKRKSGDGYYDRFRNRLIVAIHSDAGTVIGFGGRSLDGSDPKYLNSPESPIFNKSQLLYNLHRAKDQIRKTERAVLVEGYFDCITLDHAGVPGVVASMGTSLTTGQASLLRRHARRVIIAYDGDEAGRNATLRAAPILLSSGVTVEVIDPGPGEDPDSFIRHHGFDAFMEKLSSAVDVFEFALSRLAPQPASMSAAEKSAAVEAIAPLVAAVTDQIVQNDAAQRIADRLRLSFDSVWSRMKTRRIEVKGERTAVAPISTGEKRLLAAIIRAEDAAELIGKVKAEYFEDETCRGIFFALKNALVAGEGLDFSKIATDLKGEAELTRLSELVVGEEHDANDRTSLEQMLRLMERRFLDRRLKDIHHEIQEAAKADDHEREQSLLAEKQSVSRDLHRLK